MKPRSEPRTFSTQGCASLTVSATTLCDYALLTEEYESNRHMYESILARLREAAVDAGLDSADISVVDLASVPLGPSSMSPVRMGEIGFLFGLLAV